MSDNLIVENKNGICKLTINRPEKMNSLSPSLLHTLSDVMKKAEDDPNVRVVVITGMGEKAFSSGYDISEIKTGKPEEGDSILGEALAGICNFSRPVIAMINGLAIGAGLDLTMNCDFRIAADHARFGITPSKLGVIYDPNGIRRFINVVGVPATKMLFYTGRLIKADAALRLGLVDEVVPLAKLEDTVNALCEELVNNAPLSISGHKKIINALALSQVQLDEQELLNAQKLIAEAFCSEDLQEGRAAFIEKRKPQFKGK